MGSVLVICNKHICPIFVLGWVFLIDNIKILFKKSDMEKERVGVEIEEGEGNQEKKNKESNRIRRISTDEIITTKKKKSNYNNKRTTKRVGEL